MHPNFPILKFQNNDGATYYSSHITKKELHKEVGKSELVYDREVSGGIR